MEDYTTFIFMLGQHIPLRNNSSYLLLWLFTQTRVCSESWEVEWKWDLCEAVKDSHFIKAILLGTLISVFQIPYLKCWAIFWLNHVLLFLLLDVDTQVNKHYFSICNENAPQHTDIVWKGLVLQTRTWKWTAVILFAISCISNSSSKSNNSSNNVITAINNHSDINNFWVTKEGTDIGQN